jgi:phosphate transport system substrate-binding protein
MSTWAYAYQQAHPGVTINYQAKGSGAGISQYKEGTVDFGASDAPLSDSDLKSMPTPTVQFPVVAGGTALAYNLPDIASGLKLSDDVLADMFLGKIKSWNDPRIVALNADLKLPSTAITVCHRSDGSGTTYIFTDYLCAVSPAWKSGPGMGKTVNWPTGNGGTGNDGVASDVKSTPGAIGYVELAYAIQTKMTYAALKNKSGNFVSPSVESTAAAVAAAADTLKKDVRSSIVNEDGKDSYPIAGMTYVILSKTPKDKAKAASIVDFMKWVLGDGQNASKTLQYAPLPKPITDLGQSAIAEIQTK